MLVSFGLVGKEREIHLQKVDEIFTRYDENQTLLSQIRCLKMAWFHVPELLAQKPITCLRAQNK